MKKNTSFKSNGSLLFSATAAVAMLFILVAFTSVVEISAEDFKVPYPEGYRRWTHIKTSLTGFHKVAQGKNDGFHHIYANDLAMNGYKSGIFPDGAVLVFDKQQADTAGGVISPGRRAFIDVMYKDKLRFKETGGWAFEEFTGDSKTEGRLGAMTRLNCYKSCHSSKEKNDYVFSSYTD